MESIWSIDKTPPSEDSLNRDIKTDVLIIGGGLCGVLCAYKLKQRGIDCIIAEKDEICSGNTACSTAKINAQHGLIYENLFNTFGKEYASMYLRANLKAVEDYIQLCRKLGVKIDIDDSFLYAIENTEKIEKEHNVLNSIGFDAPLVNDLPLPFKIKGALCFKNQAQINPLELMYTLAKDLKIYTKTMVTDVHYKTAYTDNGCKITAENIIFATHFPFIDKEGLYFAKMYQSRSYAYAIENVPVISGMYRDADENGFSLRHYKNMMIVAGGGRKTGAKSGGYKAVRTFISENYPSAKVVTKFAAQDCITLDKVAYIGKYSKKDNGKFVITGGNKWGFTTAMTGSDIIADLIEGKQNDYSEIYSPTRSILKPQLFVNVLNTAKNFVGFAEKRCTHLGCKLKYNGKEGAYECPCHGSRYDRQGNVLDSPTVKKLK